MLAAAFFFAGVRFERERRRLEDEAAKRAGRKATPLSRGTIHRDAKELLDKFDAPVRLPPPADSPFSKTPRGEPTSDE
jgi:hypothetical protein